MSLRRFGLLILVQWVLSYQFTDDDWNSFDAYGVKLAANDIVIAQARNKDGQFLLQLGFFNISNLSSPCYVDYMDLFGAINDTFIYNVVVPKHASDSDASVIFIGENNNTSRSSVPFIGHLRMNSSCDFTYHTHVFEQWGHDEFYVVGVDPTGQLAYGFSSRFAFSYNLQTHIVNYLLEWPISNFTPRTVVIRDDHRAVIAGFIEEAQYSYKAAVYLLQLGINSSSIIDTWLYVPGNSSWQAMTSNKDAASFTPKHIMSVAIHESTSQALVGMPSMNTVLWFNITTSLRMIARRANGRQRGYGQSVGWNHEEGGPYPVLLGNTYSFPYQWSASVIYWYTLVSFLSSVPVMPLFPTAQCPRWTELDQKILTIVVRPFQVVMLDSTGQMYVITSAAEGSYPDTSKAIGSNPVFPSTILCQAGMYKYWIGLDMCYPCLVGTMSEFEGSISCVPYDCNGTNSFCPIASTTNDTYSDLIVAVSQDQAYPKSPESTTFDDILIQNMFTFGQSPHCLVISPAFWALAMTGIAGLVLFTMGALKFFHRSAKVRHTLKRIFQQIDLIKEGELWVGGLASFALIILLAFAYAFSGAYLQLYPIETSPLPTFACDATLRNAQFETSIQSLSTPRADEETPIFVSLDEQQFKLTVDFINTHYQCDTISVTQTIHHNSKSLSRECSYNRSVLSVTVVLTSHTTTLTYDFDSVLSIGGLRLSLWGKEEATNSTIGNKYYLVKELDFRQPFYIYNQTLASDASIDISLTRVINQTTPLLDNGPHFYSALWIPMITNNLQNLFLTLDDFFYYGLLQPTLSISISETSYFIQNIQRPIAKQPEVIFHNLLFTIVCLELFGLIFLIMKLILFPFFKLMQRFIEKRYNLVHPHLPRISLSSVVNNKEPKQTSIHFEKRHQTTIHDVADKKRVVWLTDDDEN